MFRNCHCRQRARLAGRLIRRSLECTDSSHLAILLVSDKSLPGICTQLLSGLTIHAGRAGEEGRRVTIRHGPVRFDGEASGRLGTFVTLELRCRRGQDTAAAILVGETYTGLASAMATRDDPYSKLTSVGIDAVASSGQIVVTNAVLAVRELADWTSRAAVCGDAEAAE